MSRHRLKAGEKTSRDRNHPEVLSAMFDHMDLAVVMANEKREIVMVNRAAETLFGFAEEELTGEPTRILYADPADFEEQGRKRFNAEAVTRPDDAFIIRYRKKDGQAFDAETHGGPIKDDSGSNRYFVSFMRDVTTRLSAERTLNQLHAITSSRQLDFRQRVNAILRLGCSHFDLPIGIFSRIEGDTYTVQEAVHPQDALTPGMTFELGGTYCIHVYQANDVKGFHHVAESEIRRHPCYENFGLEAYIGTPIVVDGQRYGTLNFSSAAPTRPFSGQDDELVRLFADWIGHELARQHDIDQLQQTQEELRRLASTDPLTGLWNRRMAETLTATEIARTSRHSHKLTVALIDFDHFKAINDRFGHAAGDSALKLFARVVEELSRSEDAVARWGGEEFLAIFPQTGPDHARLILQRIVDRLRDSDFSPNGQRHILTTSIGVTEWQEGDNPQSLVSRADGACYQAKQEGRDRICPG